MFGKFLKEPLTIFTIIAIGIFVVDGVRTGAQRIDSMEEADLNAVTTIVVNDAIVSILTEDFAWLEGRQPSDEETEQIIQEWLDQEIVFREALRQQMHLSDGKMRAHLIEKVRLLWAGAPDDPTEEMLLAFYLENIDQYYSETRISFDQVFFEQPPENAEQKLADLNAGETVVGDGYWLGDIMNDYAASILRSSFGGEFFLSLEQAPLNEWIGPLASPRGYHYVKVSSVRPPAPIAYASVRDLLMRDWVDATRFNSVSERTDAIREHFDVIYDSSGEVSSSVAALLASARNLREEGH